MDPATIGKSHSVSRRSSGPSRKAAHSESKRCVLSEGNVKDIFLQKFIHGCKNHHAASLQLARKYGVSSKTIRDIWNGRCWLRITEDMWTKDDPDFQHIMDKRQKTAKLANDDIKVSSACSNTSSTQRAPESDTKGSTCLQAMDIRNILASEGRNEPTVNSIARRSEIPWQQSSNMSWIESFDAGKPTSVCASPSSNLLHAMIAAQRRPWRVSLADHCASPQAPRRADAPLYSAAPLAGPPSPAWPAPCGEAPWPPAPAMLALACSMLRARPPPPLML